MLSARSSGRRGFTLVEVIVIIIVIAILATLAALGLNGYLHQARDAEREADITTIAEALEKYYDVNGEYPGCSTMTSSLQDAADALKIDQSALTSPREGSDSTAIICSALIPGTGDDKYAYVGESSDDCQTGNSCLGWTIQYRNEETGEIETIQSRRTVELATSGSVNLSASAASSSQINLSWTTVSNATSYRVERSTNDTFSAPVTATTTGAAYASTGLSAGTRYFYRVTPLAGTALGQPDTDDAITSVNTPSGSLAVNVSLQSSNTVARGQAVSVSCQPGTTLQFSLGSHGRNTNTSVSISYGNWGTGSTRDVSASQGYNYTFQARARCAGPDANSAEVSSPQASVTRPINTPPAPNLNGDTSMAAGYRYIYTTTSFCPAGTWLDGSVKIWNSGLTSPPGTHIYPPNGTYYDNGFHEWWYLGWAAGQVWEDTYYNSFYNCKTDFATSPNSPVRQTYITIECEPHRRTYSTSPRCDSHGQYGPSLPLGY